jgi:hypothetical protein
MAGGLHTLDVCSGTALGTGEGGDEVSSGTSTAPQNQRAEDVARSRY